MINTSPAVTSLAAALITLTSLNTFAQNASPGGEPVLEEILVTAQRRSESIQDVPMTLTAITAEDVQDFAVFRFDDLEVLSPGLSLDSGGGFGSTAQLRGVGFDSNSSGPPAVDIYINETPVDANYAFQSIYDIGQIEVLRGPQGLFRGRPSPAGAITLTTQRPELDGFRGQVAGNFGDEDTVNGQVAVNIPVVDDVLAVRLAALYDEDSGERVRSIRSGKEDERETQSWRVSLRWAPNDVIDATLTYQWLNSDRQQVVAVNGPGAGYNGPAIFGPGVGVMEDAQKGSQKSKITTLNVQWTMDAHRLVYNGAYQDNSFEFLQEIDVNNAVLNYLQPQQTESTFEVTSHELRLESTSPDAFMDYMAGIWYQDTETASTFAQPNAQPGAFGDPLNPSPVGPADDDYLLQVSGSIPTASENMALYANFTFHLSERTDLSIGARYLEEDNKRSETLNFGTLRTAIGITPGTPLNGGCLDLIAAAPFTGAEPFPGFCLLELEQAPFNRFSEDSVSEWVYQTSLQHHFNDQLMAYLSYSHSFRPAGTTVGVTSAVSEDLIQGPNEESDSFELGIRSDWLDSRLRVNASVYHQEFENFIGRFNDVPFFDAGAGQVMVSAGFTYPGDAVVDGLDLDILFQATERWQIQLTTAYSDGVFDDANVPCRDTDGDGVPDDGDVGNLSAADFAESDALFCRVDSRISTVPEWVTTLQSEYTFPVFGQEAYVRGLYNHFSSEENDGGFEAGSYGLFNLYLGLRSSNADWEVGLWAKNVFDEEELLDLQDPQTVFGAFQSGYGPATYTVGREIGLTARYLFGGS